MLKFKLPDIGEGVVEAEIVEWKVGVGDLVEENQPLVELLTDKVSLEIPSPTAGQISTIHFRLGEMVPVGAVLIEIEEVDDKNTAERTASSPAAFLPTETESTPPTPRMRATQRNASHPPPMPPRPHSSQLATQGAAAPRPSSTSEVPQDSEDWQRRPLLGLRRVIAQRMRESVQRAAHFCYVDEIDLSTLTAANDALGNSKLSPLTYIARAVVRTLPGFPMLNASIDDERNEIIEKRAIHLGIATAVGENLLVPIIHNAQTYETRALADEIERLAEAARTGNLQRGELAGGTFTISSLGKLGGLVATPIINPPESAILATNKLRVEPRYVSGELVPRTVMNLSISVDHRIADGLLAARFIDALRAILETAAFPDLFQER